jgi:transposase
MTMKCMAGIDLHSNNLFCAIMDLEGKRVFEKRLPCDLGSVLQALKPFKRRLEKIAVESTYNWYWLVDGLQDAGYPVVLANPAAMQQYNGLKHADDKSDGFFLAEMARLNILPTGHICDRTIRPVRDLLRRRMGLVHQRTRLMLSLKSLHTRMTGRDLSTGRIKALAPEEGEKLFAHPADRLITRLDLQLVEQLGRSIQEIETRILAAVKPLADYRVLQTMPGGGEDIRFDDHAGDGRSPAIRRTGQLCQLLPVRGQPADVQREKERRKQWQVRQQVSGLGVCGGGQFRPAPRRGLPEVL